MASNWGNLDKVALAILKEWIVTPNTYNNLWGEIISFQNIYDAYIRARKSKRFQSEVLQFGSKLEENIITLQNELMWKTWKPSRCRQFYVYEPKKRLISAPAFRDRVVHHAVVYVIEPLFERKFIDRSFACRVGKGTHAAHEAVIKTLRKYCRKYNRVWVLQTDISKYFASINHDILLSILRRTIRDKNVIWLMERIIRNSGFDDVGIPVGALTSQLCANIYLDKLDHFITDELGYGSYIRYMDDTLLFSDNRGELEFLREEIDCFVSTRLALKLNPKTKIYPAFQGIDFCGYRTWATHSLPRKRNVKRVKRRLKRLAGLVRKGYKDIEILKQVWASFLGYMRHCSSLSTVRVAYEETLNILKEDDN